MSDALTLQDLVSHVMDVSDMSEHSLDIRRAVRSALWGYEQATTRHQWQNYDTQITAYFNDKYDTGTVDIDADGIVTLTGGTFPTWTDLASVYIDEEKAYRVKTRDDDTTLTLEHWTGQTATGSAYVLRQDRVILPDDVREVYDVWNESEDFPLRIVDPKLFRDYDKPTIYSGSDPYIVSFRSVIRAGAPYTEMRLSPGSTTATELDVAYVRRPRRARLLVSTIATASSETVTLRRGLPNGLSSIGAIVRHAGGNTPTADFEFGIQTPHLATFEGEVSAQASTTSLTVPGISDFSDESIVITDILDIPRHLMLPCQLYAEAQMRRVGNNDIRAYQLLMREADEQLRYSMEQDAPYARRSNKPIIQVDRLTSIRDLYISES